MNGQSERSRIKRDVINNSHCDLYTVDYVSILRIRYSVHHARAQMSKTVGRPTEQNKKKTELSEQMLTATCMFQPVTITSVALIRNPTFTIRPFHI